eukprot:1709477-Rhodomonas_salina.2
MVGEHPSVEHLSPCEGTMWCGEPSTDESTRHAGRATGERREFRGVSAQIPCGGMQGGGNQRNGQGSVGTLPSDRVGGDRGRDR